MTKEDLKILKTKLPPGYRKLLSGKFGYTPTSLDKIMRGDQTNIEVIAAAVKLAQEYQEKQQALAMKINNL